MTATHTTIKRRDADHAAQYRLHSSVFLFCGVLSRSEERNGSLEADDSAAEYRKLGGCSSVIASLDHGIASDYNCSGLIPAS